MEQCQKDMKMTAETLKPFVSSPSMSNYVGGGLKRNYLSIGLAVLMFLLVGGIFGFTVSCSIVHKSVIIIRVRTLVSGWMEPAGLNKNLLIGIEFEIFVIEGASIYYIRLQLVTHSIQRIAQIEMIWEEVDSYINWVENTSFGKMYNKLNLYVCGL